MPFRSSHRLVLFRPASVVLLAVVLSLAIACGSDPEGVSVTGEVADVKARSLTEFETLTIVDEDGRTWQFVGGAFAGFTPSHLREHQALGDPVRVWYVEEGDLLRVTRIEDG